MPELRYICMSDLHLGAENSVLTHLSPSGERVDGPSPVMEATFAALDDLIESSDSDEPPTLVVHGDLFELALTTEDQAAATFDELVRLAWPDQGRAVFADELFFVPGNHDHHLWEVAREQQYRQYVAETPRDESLLRSWHVTHMFPVHDRYPAGEQLITTLAHRSLGHGRIAVRPVYPNLGLPHDAVMPEGRLAVVSHGHYTESMYRLMSLFHDIFTPERAGVDAAWHIETDNWAWVDFFWSTMGRSGDAGTDVAALYEILQDPKAIQTVLDRIADVVMERHGTRNLLHRIEGWAAKRALHRVVGEAMRLERHRPGAALTPDADRGLTAYLGGPVLAQMHDELDEVPETVDFVFGHTHKPFVATRDIDGYAAPVTIHNTGGWVVDGRRPDPVKGASVVLVDADNHVASLRLYRQEHDPATYRVEVMDPDHAALGPNPLVKWLRTVVDPEATPWRRLSVAVARTVEERTAQLTRRIDRSVDAIKTGAPLTPRVDTLAGRARHAVQRSHRR